MTEKVLVLRSHISMLPKLVAKNQVKLAISTKISACAILSCQTYKKQQQDVMKKTKQIQQIHHQNKAEKCMSSFQKVR